MKSDKTGVLTGSHILSGNEACAEGALAAGCRFLGLYPIMPSLEVSQRFLQRAPEVGATFIQMEDEVSALAAVLGASWTGKKSMTVTSGPGFSLMMEHLGLGVMLETPCVIVEVQMVGPGLGLPTHPAQADVMQSRWGSHGDYEIIAYAPSSAQEMFDFTIKAFNLSERYRVPVALMSDAHIAQLKESVVIPSADQIHIEPRRYFDGPRDSYLPFKRDKDFVPRMVDIGQGYRFHVTGLTHDDRGYPIMFEECQEYNVHPLVKKIRDYVDEIVDIQETKTDDAEVVIISYGSSSRAALKAVEQARAKGMKIGSLKLNTVWPFPDARVSELAEQVKAFVVPEMNFGQIVQEVERNTYGKANVLFLHHGDNGVEYTDDILAAAEKASLMTETKCGIIEWKKGST
ncbi:MAG: 2-oxoacid:acceptor oxidoreductase subunit alpha [candidate division WOR-3 bacterium]|nr:MAG: 2-oxoacid:acceptor oxidoreductase subunit alpha [candidate division WOR-3 bacterium]